ncbi:unnamed protein product [Spirodela intermedia]|uniref:Uncharacterized protein n=1 Tax=Spirodela intermedia TaxID=51605 RepID=A0A7I8IMW0_SPIIN|nr:unnamed protein product [Spirodela intermedia]CAA6658893.1 unnamed protein product [Spirodela intermedia]
MPTLRCSESSVQFSVGCRAGRAANGPFQDTRYVDLGPLSRRLPGEHSLGWHRVDLTHVDSVGNFTWLEKMQRALSDLIWTQCQPCADCYRQGTAIFNPSASKTYVSLPCSSKLCRALPVSDCRSGCEYIYSYGTTPPLREFLPQRHSPWGKESSSPASALGAAFPTRGRGSSRRPASSGSAGVHSPLFLSCVLPDSPTASPGSRDKDEPSLPGLPRQALKIRVTTFALNDDGTGGLIIDSGTSITYLEFEGYRLLKQALLSQVNLPLGDGSSVGLDLCFQGRPGAVAGELHGGGRELRAVVSYGDGVKRDLHPWQLPAAEFPHALRSRGDNLSFQQARCDQL